MLFDNFYRDKTVLVTGHTGFKGGWLCIWLKELGAKVIGYSKDPKTENDLFNVAGLHEIITDHRGDIKDYEKLSSVINKYKPQIVFHLAAQAFVRESLEDPRTTIEDNVMGTVNVIECIRKTDFVDSAIIVSSDKCYRNSGGYWGLRETDEKGGGDPYSASKGAVELIVDAYIYSYFQHQKTSLASVRAGNVIGGGDWGKDRIVVDIVRAIRKKESLILRNPSSIRPWQFVLEAIGGYLWLGSQMYKNPLKYNGGWNFGPRPYKPVEVKELAEKFIKEFNVNIEVVCSDRREKIESPCLILDSTKALFELKWEPTLYLDEAIKVTADWYKRSNGINGYDLCVEHINYYIDKAVSRKSVWARELYQTDVV